MSLVGKNAFIFFGQFHTINGHKVWQEMSKIMTNLLDSVNSENAPFTFRENVINGYLIEFPVYFSTRKEKSSSVLLWNVMYHIKHVHIGFSKKGWFTKIKQKCFDKVHLRIKNLLYSLLECDWISFLFHLQKTVWSHYLFSNLMSKAIMGNDFVCVF